MEIAFFNQGGEQEATISASLAPHASQTIDLPVSPQCAEEGCVYSAVINSSKAVATVANLVREAANQYSVTSYKGMDSRDLPMSATHFPAIIREQGFYQDDRVETELIFFNPNDNEVTVDGSIYDSQGASDAPVAAFTSGLKPNAMMIENTKDFSLLPFPFKGSAVVTHGGALPFVSVALIRSDKRLYSYTPAPLSTSLFLTAIHNQPLYYQGKWSKKVGDLIF